jgi:hypothetical protein
MSATAIANNTPKLQLAGGAPAGYYQPQAYAPAYAPDAYASQITPANNVGITSNASFLGWAAGVVGGIFWAVPKLARFGPIGFLGSAVVALGCGWYGGKAVEAGQELLQGQPRSAVKVGVWFACARLAAGALNTLREPGAMMAAFLIWLASWGGGKVLDMVWPKAQ